MRVRFRDPDLERLYVDATFHVPRLAPEVVRAFRKKVHYIARAADERDLRNYKALHYEKLAGKRRGQHSIRLNGQWRLILERQQDAEGHLILIIELADYH